jgi:hypothetical protein
MTEEETPLNLKTQLAAAIAQGRSVIKWAKANSVKERTAFNWAKEPEVRAEVDTIRRRALSQVTGRLTRHAIGAANQMIMLSKSAESESVRLSAARAVVASMLKVSELSLTEDRMTEIEVRLGIVDKNA